MLLLVPTRFEAERLLDGTLPVDATPVASRVGGRAVEAALVGFGPFAAGILATRALSARPDARWLLVGLAGTYDADRLPVGGLLWAERVVAGDLGRGRGPGARGPRSLGLAQVEAAADRPAVFDVLDLPPPPGSSPEDLVRGTLVTVAAASDTPEAAAASVARHPGALAEDMEGFPVALAAYLAGPRGGILRAISNRAGDGNRDGWDVDGALGRLRSLLARWPAPEGKRP